MGACEYARVITTAWDAKASRLGVSPSFEPRNPIRSARVVSRVIRIMLGDFETGEEEIFAAPAIKPVGRAATKISRAMKRVCGKFLLRFWLWTERPGLRRLCVASAKPFGFGSFLGCFFPTAQLLVHL